MRHLVLSLSLLLIGAGDLLACTCSEVLSFCQSFHSSMQIDSSRTIVVRGEVVGMRHVNESEIRMLFAVSESFHNYRNIDTLEIIDGSEANCRRTIRHYAPGQQLIVHAMLQKDSLSRIGWISVCNAAPLMVQGEWISGSITDAVTTTTLTDFRTMLNCHFKSLGIRTYPNPAREQLWIEMPSGFPMQRLTICDNLGKQVYETQETPTWGSRLTVNISSWRAGIYYIHCQASNGNEVYPLVVSD